LLEDSKPINEIEKVTIAEATDKASPENEENKTEAQTDQVKVVKIKKVPPRKIKEFDVEKLKPFFIQFEEPVHEITELEICNNTLIFFVAVVGLSLVFSFGIGVAKISSLNLF
jgi:hypothetical protein